MHTLLHSVPPALQQATTDPHLHQRLLDTHKQVWVSLLWGHCSFLLDPGGHKVLFVPSKSLFPQSCLSSGSSKVRLTVTSSKKAYAIPRSTAPRAPAPTAVHCWPIPLQETLKQSCLSLCGVSGSWFRPSYHLAGASPLPLDLGYLLKVTPVPRSQHFSAYHLAGASLPLDVGHLLAVPLPPCSCHSSTT